MFILRAQFYSFWSLHVFTDQVVCFNYLFKYWLRFLKFRSRRPIFSYLRWLSVFFLFNFVVVFSRQIKTLWLLMWFLFLVVLLCCVSNVQALFIRVLFLYLRMYAYEIPRHFYHLCGAALSTPFLSLASFVFA